MKYDCKVEGFPGHESIWKAEEVRQYVARLSRDGWMLCGVTMLEARLTYFWQRPAVAVRKGTKKAPAKKAVQK